MDMRSPKAHVVCQLRFVMLAFMMATLWTVGFGLPAWSVQPTRLIPDQGLEILEEIIHIRHREFQPQEMTIPVGQKTRLVLKNLDTELHAFFPVGLLADSHVTVSGNGAPQFGKKGLIRVLLPTRGQTEIVFTPIHPGTYPYFCDLPGHVMRGTIIVPENPSVVQ